MGFVSGGQDEPRTFLAARLLHSRGPQFSTPGDVTSPCRKKTFSVCMNCKRREKKKYGRQWLACHEQRQSGRAAQVRDLCWGGGGTFLCFPSVELRHAIHRGRRAHPLGKQGKDVVLRRWRRRRQRIRKTFKGMSNPGLS